MTIGELRRRLAEYPDFYPVVIGDPVAEQIASESCGAAEVPCLEIETISSADALVTLEVNLLDLLHLHHSTRGLIPLEGMR